MKVAFLNCTDELNPEAGSELTCVFLDKIPGTLEFCKRLKLRCTKALYMAAQNDFNNASLETLNAAAKILGVKYDKVKRK